MLKSMAFTAFLVLIVSGCLCGSQSGTDGTDDSTATTVESSGRGDISQKTTSTTSGGIGQAIKGSISDLLSMGKSVKCTVEQDTQAGKMSSTVYVSGERFRMDGKIEGANPMEFHSISDGQWMYTWSSQSQEGFKMKYEKGKAQQGQGSNGPDLNMPADYQCVPWVASSGMFSTPPGMKFTDLNAMMQNLGGGQVAEGSGEGDSGLPSDSKAKMCAVCDSAGNAKAKAQCRTQLGC